VGDSLNSNVCSNGINPMNTNHPFGHSLFDLNNDIEVNRRVGLNGLS
jgi:hypothetical protein